MKVSQKAISRIVNVGSAPLIFIGIFLYLASLTKSDFWADDFTNMHRYFRTLGPIESTDGKLIINIYWYLGSIFYGDSSALPYLLTNLLIFMISVFLLSRFAILRSWHPGYVQLVLAVGVGTASLYPLLLWSSNIVHLASFLGLAIALNLQQAILLLKSRANYFFYTTILGLLWSFSILSNPLYFGFVVIGILFIYEQVKTLDFIFSTKKRGLFIGCLIGSNFILPCLSFIFAYSRVTQQSAYRNSGTRFIKSNFSYYFDTVLQNRFLSAMAIIVFFLVLRIVFISFRNQDYVPLAFLSCSFLILIPIFIQGQQRGYHYFVVPTFLLLAIPFSFKFTNEKAFTSALRNFLIASLLVVTLFNTAISGSWVRAWFVDSPFGSPISEFRTSLGKVIDNNQAACVSFDMTEDQRNFLVGGMGGKSGFYLPPINSSQIFFDFESSCTKTSEQILVVGIHPSGYYYLKRS